MPKQKTPEKEVLDIGAGEPIVLVGQPGALRGELHLQNAGEERLVFRGAEVHSLAAPKAAKGARARVPVETAPLMQKLPAVIVRPG